MQKNHPRAVFCDSHADDCGVLCILAIAMPRHSVLRDILLLGDNLKCYAVASVGVAGQSHCGNVAHSLVFKFLAGA